MRRDQTEFEQLCNWCARLKCLEWEAMPSCVDAGAATAMPEESVGQRVAPPSLFSPPRLVAEDAAVGGWCPLICQGTFYQKSGSSQENHLNLLNLPQLLPDF